MIRRSSCPPTMKMIRLYAHWWWQIFPKGSIGTPSKTLDRNACQNIDSISESKEFLYILRDPKVSKDYLWILAFRLLRSSEKMKAAHPSRLISFHHSWIRGPRLSSGYQDFSKWKVLGLRGCDPNSRQIGAW